MSMRRIPPKWTSGRPFRSCRTRSSTQSHIYSSSRKESRVSKLKPARRWQPAWRPFKREALGDRALARMERMVKGPIYGCRMCGNCLLQETAFICPMECPKGLRNGPCGGSTSEKCYVDPTRPCIWYKIYDRAHNMGREELLLEVLPPLDWDKVGTETWGDVTRSIGKFG